MVELSLYRKVNILGAVILMIIGAGWATYSFARDGQYIIQNGMVTGVWVVDPMMKVLPIVLMAGSLVIIVLAFVWPRTAFDEV